MFGLNKIGLKLSRGKIKLLVILFFLLVAFPQTYFPLSHFSSISFKLITNTKTKNLSKTFYLRYILLIKREHQQRI